MYPKIFKYFFCLTSTVSLFHSPSFIRSSELLLNETNSVFLNKRSPLFLISEKVVEDILGELNLVADRQYDLNEKIFIAEGNVKAILQKALFEADRLEFDRVKKILKVTGNVSFVKGSQYFKADSLIYNFDKEIGELNSVYGVISIKSLVSDMKFNNQDLEVENNKIKIGKINQVKLIDGYILKTGGTDTKFESIFTEEPQETGINQWRIQADKIVIKPSNWTANKISLTNDPLEPIQTRIEASNVIAREDSDNSISISSTKSRLVIEEKLSFPLLKKRKFGEKQEFLWMIGLDFKDRDGLFISRKTQPINLFKSINLYLQPQFMFQRAVRGKTSSYVASGASPLTDKVTKQSNFADLFGLKADIKGSLSKWKIDFTSNFSTFDSARFSDGYRYSGSIGKEIELGKYKFNTSLFTAYRYKAWNGSLGEREIHNASGVYIDKNGDFNYKNIFNKYSIGMGIGNYEAEKYTNKEMIDMWKNNIYSSLESKFNILKFKKNKNDLYMKYVPKEINPGIDFKTKISGDYSLYGNGSAQALVTFGAGPELRLGSLSNRFLDYTRISVMPTLTIKDGESPFKFDNNVDLRTINVEFEQQVYGPLLVNSGFEFNIDRNSNNYGKTIASQTALIYQRRSYGMGIFYQPHKKVGGIMIRLNGFNFKGTGDDFIDRK